MIRFPFRNLFYHFLIKLRWKRWLFPFLCSVPYVASILWLIGRGQFWIANILLAPLLMTFLLALITFVLAKLEFRR